MKKNSKPVAEWKKLVEDYQHPHLGRALWQCANTLGPILGIWIALYFLKDASWLLTIALATLAGLFLVRAFIIFHDCGHGSFFKNKKANDALGFFTGMLTFTPYHHWKWEHAVHHATNGDLDKRGIGDAWTMTVEEYLTSSRRIKLSYRLLRNPFILFGLAPLFLFFVLERFPSSQCKPRERRSVYLMNLTLLLYGTAMSMIYGLVPFLIFQTIMMGVAGGVEFGCSMFSTNSRILTGHKVKTGTSPPQRWKEAVTTNFPRSCNGSLETLASIIFITSTR